METKPKRQIKSFKSGAPKLKRGRKPGATSTSPAKLKRKAEGLEPPKSRAHQIGGAALAIDMAAPTTHPETRKQVARLVAGNPDLQKVAIKAFVAQEQQLVVKMRQSIMQAAPESAEYLRDLVRGKHESAPHAVRMGAASKIIDSAVEFHSNSAGSKDLSEMTAAEIAAELNALGNALASRTAEDAEVIEQEPEPARPGKRALE